MASTSRLVCPPEPPAEGRAGRAARSPGPPRPAGRPGGTGTGRPTRTKAPPGGRAVRGVAGGTELSVLPPQRLRSLSHPGTTLWGPLCPQPLASHLL